MTTHLPDPFYHLEELQEIARGYYGVAVSKSTRRIIDPHKRMDNEYAIEKVRSVLLALTQRNFRYAMAQDMDNSDIYLAKWKGRAIYFKLSLRHHPDTEGRYVWVFSFHTPESPL